MSKPFASDLPIGFTQEVTAISRVIKSSSCKTVDKLEVEITVTVNAFFGLPYSRQRVKSSTDQVTQEECIRGLLQQKYLPS